MRTLKIFRIRSNGISLAIMVGFILMLFSGTAFAQDPTNNNKNNKKKEKMQEGVLKEAKVTARILTTVEEVGPMKVRLNVLNPTGKPVRVSILNYQNQPVFQDSFRDREYNKVLNFNTTVPGRYSLHVDGRKNSETRRFEVESKEKRDLTASALERSGNTDVMATIYKTSPTKVMLQMVNNTGKPVEYVFRDTDQQVIHRGYVKEEKFAKTFDMADITDGKYTVEVKYLTDKAATRSFDMNTIYERSFTWVDKKGKPLKPAQ